MSTLDLLDRLIGHDVWTTRHLLERCREVDESGLNRPFDVGHGTLRATLVHLVGNVEAWTDVMHGRTTPQRPAGAAPAGVTDLIGRFDAASADFLAVARRIRDEGRWDDTYVDALDSTPRTRSFGGTILHLCTHGMAHRTEILHMLDRLGVKNLIEGDALSWESRHRHASG